MIDDSVIVRLLRQYNPWWLNGESRLDVPAHQRHAYKEVEHLLRRGRLRRFAMLIGPRRVGKTTVMEQQINELLGSGIPGRQILYLSFDNPVFAAAGMERVLQVYEQMHPVEHGQGLRYYFFDEVQNMRNWSLWVKVLYDTRKDIRLVATGSASPVIVKGAADSGVGRWVVIPMPTLNFHEYCNLKGISISGALPEWNMLASLSPAALHELMGRLAPLQTVWNHYLLTGGFPEMMEESDVGEIQRMLREDVIDKVLKRDIPSLFEVRNPADLEKIFLYLCLHSSNIINFSTMCRELEGISQPTLTRYVQYLRDAHLIYLSHPVAHSGKKTLSGQPKIYVADPALREAVLMQPMPFEDATEMGIVAKTAVFKHFYQACRGSQVGYMRLGGRSNKEIDVAVQYPTGQCILCEVKYKNSAQLTRDSGILTQCRTGNPQLALLATKNADDYGLTPAAAATPPLLRIPAFALCYLLGKEVS